MGDGTASAIPSDLTNWANWASGLNESLTSMGRQVNQAIKDFNGAPQQPRFIGLVDYVGDDVLGYAARNGVIDEWVGEVGQAFIKADRKGVPPQIYRAEQHDRITGITTVSEADLAGLVDKDPAEQADDAAKGAELAARLKRAEDANDEALIQAILRQLKRPSQEFAYAFFNELGPDQTIKTLIAIKFMEHNGLLQPFDEALGQASQHPAWDPKFTSALLDPRRQAWGQRLATGDIQLSMLRHGTFSADFLTQSADYFLFSFKPPFITDLDRDRVVFDALANDPNAAYNYLTGHLQGIGDQDLPRVQHLLLHSRAYYDKPGRNTALGELIEVAGFSDNGRADNGNQLLQAIGSIDNQNLVADDIRPGIARLLAGYKDDEGKYHPGYIGNFATYGLPANRPEGQFTWQERLFMIAEMNVDGSVDKGRMTDLQNAVAKWLNTQLRPMNDASAGIWFDDAGTLYGLTLLPARKAGWNNYDMKKASDEFRKNVIDYATGFLPGWFHQLKDVPLTTISSIAKSHLESDLGRAQTADWDKHQAASNMLPNLVEAMAAGNPNFLPPNLRGRPPTDPQVRGYLNSVLHSVAVHTQSSSADKQDPTPDQTTEARWVNAILRMRATMDEYYIVPVEDSN
jgi:hypothetical protein